MCQKPPTAGVAADAGVPRVSVLDAAIAAVWAWRAAQYARADAKYKAGMRVVQVQVQDLGARPTKKHSLWTCTLTGADPVYDSTGARR